MSTCMNSSLKEVLESILLDWAMMFTESQDNEEVNPQIEWHHVSIKYYGDHTGELNLWAPDALSRILAANVLGVDDTSNLKKNEIVDALKELANMACGHLMTSYYKDGLYSIKAPEWNDEIFSDSKNCLNIYVDGLPLYFCAE